MSFLLKMTTMGMTKKTGTAFSVVSNARRHKLRDEKGRALPGLD
jgi:hypothetical protein